MKGKHNLAVYFIVSYSDGNCSNSKNDDAAFCCGGSLKNEEERRVKFLGMTWMT